MTLSVKVMLGELPTLCLLIATLAVGSESEATELCDRGLSWWDRNQEACIPCTICDPKLYAVKRPCYLNGDTVCHPLHEVRIGLYQQNVESDSSETDYYDYSEFSELSEDYEVKWEVQTIILALAASGCVVFFVIVLYLTVQHSRQWKALKQALRSDVQDLSAKLKLMEAGEAPVEAPVLADHHIYCNIHVTKEALLGASANKFGLSNVYTQDKHPN